MSIRKTNYSPRPPATGVALGNAIALTRAHLEHQPPGASFGASEMLGTWKCECGYVNPDTKKRSRCRGCNERRSK